MPELLDQWPQFYDLETFKPMIEYLGPWDGKLLTLRFISALNCKKKNGLAARLNLGWPVNGSVVHSILWKAPQAPGGMPRA